MLPIKLNYIKFFTLVIFAFLLFYSTNANAQCGYGWNNSTFIGTPTTGSQFTPNIQAGSYFLMNVVVGETYTVRTCGLTTWDTQLSLYNQSTAALVGYNDDSCGSLQSQISFTATFTGQVRTIINQFNCIASGNVSQIEYFGTVSGPVLTLTNTTVDEDDGTATFTVTHSGTATGGPFTATFNTVDGSTTSGSDYAAITGGILNFDGTSGDFDTITISITDDTLYEETETFTIDLTSVSDPSVDISNTGVGTIDDNEVILNNTDLVLIEEFDGYIGYTSTGGSLRTQSNNVNACTVTTTSNNTLTSVIPAAGIIDRAFLYWSHSGQTPDAQVTFEGVTVDADLMYTSSAGSGRIFYGGVSDVTSIVNGITNPNTNSFDFSGLTIDTSATYCNSATVLGGWSLMVFYSDPALPASTINLYQGFHGESNSSSSYTLDGFFAIGASGSKTTVLSWEGDQNLSNNEDLEVTTGLGTFDLIGDGDNTLFNRNPFNSTIYDNTGGTTVNITTSYGVDLDTYDVSPFITAGESSLTTQVQSGQDFVILNAVVLKVPSNLVTGVVFEDLNYGGGLGRNLTDASGVPIANVDLELYDIGGSAIQATTTDAAGVYVFGGMANGTYNIRAINNTVSSSRGGGTTCAICIPVQTFKTDYIASSLIADPNSVGGENPSGVDSASGTFAGSQSISSLTIFNEGVAGMDFGFNFNTIVNTNEDGQGSLEQFIVNSNALDASGLDIEANSIFNPAPGDDTSIFIIPSPADPLGRTADANFTSGYFYINIPNGNSLPIITGASTKVDGRTQTAYSGDTNTGTVGSGGTTVGTSANTLPDYERPEIQVRRDQGDVFRTQGNLFELRNISVYADNNASVRIDGGSATLVGNLLGVNALGALSGNVDYGIEITSGISRIEGNYIAHNTDEGIYITGGTSVLIQDNHITDNGSRGPCYDNIAITNGTGIVIRRNLIDRASSLGIDDDTPGGGIVIFENTITNSGQDGGNCGGSTPENAGIKLDASNSSISNNIIASNGGAGIVLAGGSANLISQNSIYANGTSADALGIDIDASNTFGDGVTLNDVGDVDGGPNGSNNFPVITTSYLGGGALTVRGWARPGAIIEWFITDINEGTASTGDNQLGLSTDYGEGQVYLGTSVEGSAADLDSTASTYADDDGNTDTTNKFHFVVSVPSGIQANDLITSTATIGNSTSEFSPFSIVKIPTIITNRRITYRVKSN